MCRIVHVHEHVQYGYFYFFFQNIPLTKGHYLKGRKGRGKSELPTTAVSAEMKVRFVCVQPSVKHLCLQWQRWLKSTIKGSVKGKKWGWKRISIILTWGSVFNIPEKLSSQLYSSLDKPTSSHPLAPWTHSLYAIPAWWNLHHLHSFSILLSFPSVSMASISSLIISVCETVCNLPTYYTGWKAISWKYRVSPETWVDHSPLWF